MYFMNKRFKEIQDKNSTKEKDEILTKWLENMQQTLETRLENVQGTVNGQLKNVQSELHQTTNTLNKRFDSNAQDLNKRLDHSAELMSKLQKELGSMSEIGRSMKDLQDFLKSPKLRGNIGEEVLKDMLEQMLPSDQYKLQHTFSTGDRVDALLKLTEGYVSVDSKFPMENFTKMMQAETQDDRERCRKDFHKDVKKHINDISKKYILTDEGTVDFALMYIPSEAIYYEVVVNNPELGKYAWEKRVLPVSPNVFYSYLKAIMIGLEGKKVESRAKEILRQIQGIKKDAEKFSDGLRVLTKHITNAKNSADTVNSSFEKLDAKIDNLSNVQIAGEEKANIIESDMGNSTENVALESNSNDSNGKNNSTDTSHDSEQIGLID